MQETQKLNALPDEELMCLYQAGDPAAFELLYRRHSGRVYEYLKKKTTAENAGDLLQEIFERLHKSRDKYNPQYPFLPWLFTVSRNALFDFFRAAETKRTGDIDPDSLPARQEAVFDSASPKEISEILSVLPDNQRRAIALRYLDEWSFEKIAENLKTSPENVRQLVSRGLKKLRSGFGGEKNP